MEINQNFGLHKVFPQLTAIQLERALEQFHNHLQQDLLGQAVVEDNSAPTACPHCHVQQVIHWGQSRGLPRYRCKKCGKTFNQFYGTDLAHLRQREKWISYIDCLSEGCSIREAARKCQISRNTSFLWRHRFLRYALTTQTPPAGGIVEADGGLPPESFVIPQRR